ncbi:unnamed protein product [Candidula unifasciata]|uniref:Small ribosomal subunit protein uS9 n=1 Tax=Candidula unifasciata TaxID=100452 RepID=A0A8S4A0Y2_9EUPU|nr:unnamed protein product [Candidula unifasciata]
MKPQTVKKTTTAVAHCKRRNRTVKVNGCPLDPMDPEILHVELQEPVLLLGKEICWGGYVAQIYNILSNYQKYVDAISKKEIRDVLIQYDRSLLGADPRCCVPTIFRGPGAGTRCQKSYR